MEEMEDSERQKLAEDWIKAIIEFEHVTTKDSAAQWRAIRTIHYMQIITLLVAAFILLTDIFLKINFIK